VAKFNYGGNKHMGNGGVCIWTDSNFAGSKINKQTKRKRNTRRGLQGRLELIPLPGG
jgi:hypothetical protein